VIVRGAVPTLPSSLLEPVWDQFAALLPARPVVAPTHPLGCYRPRIADRLVFEHVVAALVQGSGYERIATAGWSDRTIRRRRREWAATGVAEVLQTLLRQYDRSGSTWRIYRSTAASPKHPVAGRRRDGRP
jgi:hypothetical protein